MTRIALVLVAISCCLPGCANNRILSEKPAPAAITAEKHRAEKADKAQAIAAFERKRDEAQWQAAMAFSDRGDRQSCRQSLTELLGRSPQHAGAHLLMAELLVEEAPQQAIQHADAVLANEPENMRAQQAKALATEQLGAPDAVPVSYEVPISGPPEADNNTPRFEAPDPGDAVYTPILEAQSLPPAAAVSADTVDAAVVVGTADEPEGAPARLTTRQSLPVCALHPSQQSETAEGGQAAEANSQPAEPAEFPAVQAEPSASALQPALHALQAGSREEAIGLLRAELAQSPQSAEVHRALALALYQQGDYQAAHQALTQALSLDNANAASYFLMGCTLTRLGQPQAAEQHYQLAGRLDPKYGTLPDRR